MNSKVEEKLVIMFTEVHSLKIKTKMKNSHQEN